MGQEEKKKKKMERKKSGWRGFPTVLPKVTFVASLGSRTKAPPDRFVGG